MPGYPGLRLWPDSRADVLARAPGWRAGRELAHYAPHKRVIAGMALAAAPARLARVYVLDDPSYARREKSSQITIERTEGAKSVELLLPHLFRLRTRGMPRLERELCAVTSLAGEVPVCRLRLPHRWSVLGRLHEAVARDLAD
jgi:hypothetical protein